MFHNCVGAWPPMVYISSDLLFKLRDFQYFQIKMTSLAVNKIRLGCPVLLFSRTSWLSRTFLRCMSDSVATPTTCPGANYFKEGSDPVLKPDNDYPDWLWTLGGPKKDLKDMSPEVDGKAYYKRLRKQTLRNNNTIRKQKKF